VRSDVLGLATRKGQPRLVPRPAGACLRVMVRVVVMPVRAPRGDAGGEGRHSVHYSLFGEPHNSVLFTTPQAALTESARCSGGDVTFWRLGASSVACPGGGAGKASATAFASPCRPSSFESTGPFRRFRRHDGPARPWLFALWLPSTPRIQAHPTASCPSRARSTEHPARRAGDT
jgi:hypothetical protein